MTISQEQRERLEMDFWRDSEKERPGAQSLDAFTNKMSEGRVLLEKLRAFASIFEEADTILEVGGGQGWAACMIARQFPHATVFTSDIAEDAVASLGEWERVFKVSLGGCFSSRSYEIPLRDGSVDLVVAFASAHHFGRHRRTLMELRRVLTDQGCAIYLHEPACRNYIYRVALARVNKKRPVVREDLIRIRDIKKAAADCKLTATVIAAPTTTYRGAVETIYYFLLQKMRFLQKILPCSIDLLLQKGSPRGPA